MGSGCTTWIPHILNAHYCTLIWILVADTLVAFWLQDFSFIPTRGLKKGRCTEVHFTFIAYYITLQRSYKKWTGLFELQQGPFLTKLSTRLPLGSCVPTSMRTSHTSFKNDQFLSLCYMTVNSLYTLCFYGLPTLLMWRNVRKLMDTDGGWPSHLYWQIHLTYCVWIFHVCELLQHSYSCSVVCFMMLGFQGRQLGSWTLDTSLLWLWWKSEALGHNICSSIFWVGQFESEAGVQVSDLFNSINGRIKSRAQLKHK